jgi:hypothetical protein
MRLVGKRLGKDMPAVRKALAALPQEVGGLDGRRHGLH